jgi:hypothetical protein
MADYIPYRPSNGIEGAAFEFAWCQRCKADADWDYGSGCPILANVCAYQIDDPKYPKEWREDGPEGPRCTAFDAIEEPPSTGGNIRRFRDAQ